MGVQNMVILKVCLVGLNVAVMKSKLGMEETKATFIELVVCL